MSAELLFLLVSMTGSFFIGFATHYFLFGRQRSELQKEIENTHERLETALAELQQAQANINSLTGNALKEYSALSSSLRSNKGPESNPSSLSDTSSAIERVHPESAARNVSLSQESEKSNFKSEEISTELPEELAEELGLSILGEVPDASKDDLTRVQGISAYIEERLNKVGIRTFEQLARLDNDQVAIINDAIELLPGRIRREDWVGQCQRLFAEVRRR